MNVKRYFAKDMQEAMTKIRKELGSDAVILNNKTVRKKGLGGLFSKPMMEVVVAYESKEPPKLATPKQEPPERVLTYSPPRPPLDPAQKPVLVSDIARAFSIVQENETQRTAAEPAAPAAIAAPIPLPAPEIKEPPAELPLLAGESASAAPDPPKDQSQTVEQLDSRINELSNLLTSFAGKLQKLSFQGEEPFSEPVQELHNRLVGNEVDTHLADALAKEAQAICLRHSANPYEVMEQLVRQNIGDPSPIKTKKFKRGIVILLGTTGVGKTTTLVKLAAYYAIKENLKIGLVNADTYRIAAQEQLRTYSEILEVPLSVIYSPKELTQVLEETMADRDLVFIDTAGKRPSDEAHRKEITELIALSEADEIYLVISATTAASTLRSVIENYSFIKNYKILVTKMDEAPNAGVLLNACYYSERPISYTTAGQSVPDDIEIANMERIISRLLG